MLDFACAQFIEQKARKKLVNQVRTDEMINRIMNSNLFQRHSRNFYGKPSELSNGTEILAKPPRESSELQGQIRRQHSNETNFGMQIAASDFYPLGNSWSTRA